MALAQCIGVCSSQRWLTGHILDHAEFGNLELLHTDDVDWYLDWQLLLD